MNIWFSVTSSFNLWGARGSRFGEQQGSKNGGCNRKFRGCSVIMKEDRGFSCHMEQEDDLEGNGGEWH